MADNRKLAIGLQNFTPAAREDMALRAKDLERGKTAELLRRAGQEMYDNPVVNTAISFTPGAGDLQSGYEAIRSAREGNYGESALNALGVLPFIPSMGVLGKTVWHGSPHTFDKFDLSKIGTGEGAQAYGHGLYLAEAPETAKTYIGNAATSKEIGAKYLPKAKEGSASQEIYEMYAAGYTPQAVNYAIEKIAANEGPSSSYLKSMIKAQNKMLGEVEKTGSLYKVDLPDEQIAKMLDWDKPLSQQSDYVRNLLTESGAINDISEAARIQKYADARGMTLDQATQFLAEHPETLRRMKAVGGDATGHEIYRSLAKAKGGAAENGSQFLNELGIPGIQYLDGGSRGAGEGTRNYVVFSDELPQILERNGQPVGMFGGGK